VDATFPQRSPLGGLKLKVEKIGPWFLRAAALLRVAALGVAGLALYNAGAAGITLAAVLALSAVGLWFRRVWPWRVAVVVDIALVIFFAIALIDTGDLRLFSWIAAAVTVDVGLLGLGQAARARPPLRQWPSSIDDD
jgi:hypothetical protein